MVDASDPTFRAQLEVTRGVLAEIGADAVPTWLLLNKVDQLGAEERDVLRQEFPDAIQRSAHEPTDVADLRETLSGAFDRDLADTEVLVPWARGALVGRVHSTVRVLREAHEADGIRFHVRGRKSDAAKLVEAVGGE